eukprot:GFYU01001634.1.p1 GENE.GFYU01001634.1~~GFYU01001634.1.p1  ORF type:complete len:119 (-),score=27.79 GFYU01001634.1:46-402(-)
MADLSPMDPFGTIAKCTGKFFDSYGSNTPQFLKVMDCFLFFQFLTGVAQFVYAALVGSFPFNSFLSGFIGCVGCFILTACFRLQLNPENKLNITPERAFADYAVCNIVLFLVVMNFIG